MTEQYIAKKKILIADDEEDIRIILKRLLSNDYELEEHSNSNSVHSRLFHYPHKTQEDIGLDMLILDNSMGGDHKGADLADMAAIIYPKMPILIASGEDIAGDYPHIVKRGVKVYRKPYDLIELKEEIGRLLRGAEQ